jgi:hypothetical protein
MDEWMIHDSGGGNESKARMIYELYFYIGIFTTLTTGVLLILYSTLKLWKAHPNRIMVNILLLQFLNSLKYLVTFSVYKISGSNLDNSPFAFNDFGFMKMD